jgi:hypothetical protein
MTLHHPPPYDMVPTCTGKWLVRDAQQRTVAECYSKLSAEVVLDALRGRVGPCPAAT